MCGGARHEARRDMLRLLDDLKNPSVFVGGKWVRAEDCELVDTGKGWVELRLKREMPKAQTEK